MSLVVHTKPFAICSSYHEKLEEIRESGVDSQMKKYKKPRKWIERNRDPKDKRIKEELHAAFTKRRTQEKKKVDWRWLQTEYKKAFERVHGRAKTKKVSGSVLSRFLKHNSIAMLKRTNKKSLTIEERLPLVQDYHRISQAVHPQG